MTWKTVDGSATAGSGDYTGGTGTLTFLPGQTVKTITVRVNGDLTSEANETFTAQISNASGRVDLGLVHDRHDPERRRAADREHRGHRPRRRRAGPRPLVFSVARSGSTSGSVVIGLTWGGTAVFETDYTVTATGGTLASNG